ncbi:hypothetical protein PoB_001869500 [Plakobranchus ocellatus]|uniref:Uncharacterized protein n=1 Tax=Plakobranchus ocellatus TaxID=259542 RepID=A0AAV3ZAM4_9GAST|nr:hypothetical protein PoB_001869500 [Plakobranchus ocellatus]
MSLLDALYVPCTAWDQVDQTIVQKRFKHAGFMNESEQEPTALSASDDVSPTQGTNDASAMIRQFDTITDPTLAINPDHYINIDEGEQTGENVTHRHCLISANIH